MPFAHVREKGQFDHVQLQKNKKAYNEEQSFNL